VHGEQLRQLRDEFQRLASEALERAQKQFTEQAGETLKLHRAEAAKGLAESKTALSDLVAPMRETLGRYGEELKAMEQKREHAYGSLSEQLAGVALGQAAVKAEAGKIVSALRSSSKASGAWGEAQLRNVLDMAGLREGIDFELQASTTDADGQRRRPDAVLKTAGWAGACGRQQMFSGRLSEQHRKRKPTSSGQLRCGAMR
jgi:DNA recombination protein RmuC